MNTLKSKYQVTVFFLLCFLQVFSITARAESQQTSLMKAERVGQANTPNRLFHSSTQKLNIEPPNWWYGLAEDTVQLMIHGENINHLEAKIPNGQRATISNHTSTSRKNYLWITLDLSKINKAEEVQILLKDGSKNVHTITYPIYAKPKMRNGFDQSDVIYLITPDRFSNADTSNDNIAGYKEASNRQDPSGRHGGDLLGIQNHIDDIASMGFTAIWLNPIIENDNAKYSYHGYAATDFYKIDARFGSNEQYKDFVNICHEKGVKVIMDMIHNHCSIAHPWLSDLPAEEWINEWDSYTETNHIKSTLQDIHAAEIEKKTYLDGWFVPTMPDLNQRNPLLSTYLIQNAIWWSLFLELDGIRMDTYSYSDRHYMQRWINRMNTEVPEVSIVGEEWSTNPAHVAYWQKDKHNQDGFESDLEYLMDFPTNQLLAESLTEEESWAKGFVKLYESIANDFIYPHPEDLLIFLDNHDMVRGYTSLREDLDLMKTAMLFCMTTRGVPQVYYGTEVLMTSPAQRDDGRLRGDYPGGWDGDKVDAFTGVGLTQDQTDFKQFLTELLQMRKQNTVFHKGKLIHYVPKDGVYVYFRQDDKHTAMVILNKNQESYRLETGRFSQFMDGSIIKGLDLLSDKVVDFKEGILLEPRKSYVIKLQ